MPESKSWKGILNHEASHQLSLQKGRCLVAARALDPLEIILWDRAAIVAPHHDANPLQCLHCLGDAGGGE